MADQKMKTTFQAAIDAGKINGAVFCATDAKGAFVHQEAMGHRFLLSGEKKDLKLDDVLYLASGTKLVTTIAVLQCVEDGTLSLDGDLSKLAPELASRQIITGFETDGKTPILEPLTSPITIRMLLTHSSGLVYYFLNPLVYKWRELSHDPNDNRKRTVEETFDHPLVFQPGSSWMYGPGVDWAGRILEHATGQTLGEHMHKRIFTPLGISDAQFLPVTREDLRARLVDLNPDDPDALGQAPLGGNADGNKRTKGDFGGQNLFMTAPDYVKILHSLLANDGRVLKPETVNDMFENHITSEAMQGQREALDGPLGSGLRNGVTTKAGFGFGGLLTLQDVEGWYGEKTLSWGGGFTLAWFIDRKNDLCGVGAVQGALPMEPDAMESLRQTFRQEIYKVRAGSGIK